MPWSSFGRRPSKWLQSKRRKNPEKTNNSDDRQTDIGALMEPTQPSGITSESTNDTEQANNTNVPLKPTQNSGDTTASSEPEDLWAKAEQRLAQDEKMGPILKKAIEIIEEAGLKSGPHGTANHHQLHSFLDTKVYELKQKELKVRFDDRCIGVRDQFTKLIGNILVLKDIVNAAASASPPAALACAGLTVSLLVRPSHPPTRSIQLCVLLKWTLANSPLALHPSSRSKRQPSEGTGENFGLDSSAPHEGRSLLAF